MFIYEWDGASWGQTAFIEAQEQGQQDEFGRSVSLDGDRLAIGVHDEDSAVGAGPADNSLPGSGAAYVYELIGGVWTSIGFLQAPNADAGDSLGLSIALSGDRVVVGTLD